MSVESTGVPSPPMLVAGRDMHFSGGNVIHAPHGQVQLHINEGNDHVYALNKLSVHSAPDALHTSKAVFRQDICTPGTRTVTLAHLQSLATSSYPASPDVIWMHGPAGAGKSAIMRTLANRLASDNLLLATFFFFRSESQRNTSTPFIPTLASQVWSRFPAAQPLISRPVQHEQNLFSRPAHLQMPQLLEAPLLAALGSPDAESRWSPSTPLSIVVDGLDECTDLDGQAEIIRAMVQLAASIRSQTDRRIKIFIASRPERRIKPEFETFMKDDQHIAIISLDSSDANIHLFYDERFDQMRKEHNLPETWPSEEDIKWFTDKTSGQYAFAGLSTRYMAGGDPVLRLKIIRQAIKDDTVEPFDALDKLYAIIFEQLPQEMRRPAVLILRLRLKGGAELYGQASLLEPILQLPRGYVDSLIPYLSSLIDFERNLESYHASLADFLTDPSRSEKSSLYVDDITLSHVVQRGLLALVGPGSQLTPLVAAEMDSLSIFIRNQHLPSFIPESPLPINELNSLLKKINPAQLNLWSYHFLFQLLVELKHGLVLYRWSAALWHTLHINLPKQMKLSWEKRTASYMNYADLAWGLVLMACTSPTNAISLVFEKSRHLLLKLIRSHGLSGIDSTQGWNFSTLLSENSQYLFTSAITPNVNIWMRDYGPRVWAWVRAILFSVSQSQETDHVNANNIKFDHNDYGCAYPEQHIGTFQGGTCSTCFRSIQKDFLWAILYTFEGEPIPPEEFLMMNQFTRTHAVCWEDCNMLRELQQQGEELLHKLRHIPSFTNLKIKRSVTALRVRVDELDALADAESAT